MRRRHLVFLKSVTAALSSFVILLVNAVMAQEGPFGNASLHGTYSCTTFLSGADEPVPSTVAATSQYFDGNGNHRVVFPCRKWTR